MSRATRYANRLIRERQAAESPEEQEVVAQTPEAQYEAAHGLRDWYRGVCQCRECLKLYGTRSQTLIDSYGHHDKQPFTGRRVPHVATMLCVRREWNPYTMQIEREVIGTIEYSDYLDGRRMSDDAREIAEATEPARVVTGGTMRRGEVLEAGLRVHKTRKTRIVVLRGHCGICDEPKEPGQSYCGTCRRLLRKEGGEAELAERLEAGKRKRESR